MKTHVKGRHVQVTPEVEEMIGRKLDKVERILNDSAVSVQVTLSQERRDHIVEIVLHARGDHVLHSDGEGPTWVHAVSAAAEKIDQQAHTLKGKWESRHRRSTSESSS